MSAGRFAEACASFAESYRLSPAVTTLLNLGNCREQTGQLASAWGLFIDAERQTRDGGSATSHQLHASAAHHAEMLEGRVSKLAISVPESRRMEVLGISRDAESVEPAMWNRALPVDGGSYLITVRLLGGKSWSKRVNVSTEGDVETVEIPDLRSLEVVAPPNVANEASPDNASAIVRQLPSPQASPSKSNEAVPTLPLALGLTTLALFGAGLGLELWGESTYDTAKLETNPQQRDSSYESANTKRYFAEGATVAGLACAGTGLWLFFRDRPSSVSSDVVVVPVLSEDGSVGFSLTGRFQ